MPGFQQVALSVIEQDVGLRPVGEAGVREALAGVTFEWAFAHTARIDAFIRHGQHQHRGDEAQLAATIDVFKGHPKQRQLVELVHAQQRQLFNTSYIHAIQRILVQEAREGSEQRPGDLERLQTAFLGISNVVVPASARPKVFDLSYHLATMMRSVVGNSTEPPVEAITRAYAMYYEFPRRDDAAEILNYIPREEWEPDLSTELAVHERFMVGMAIMGAVGVQADQLPDARTGVPEDYFDALAKEITDGDAGRLRAAIATDRTALRESFAQEAPELRNTAANSIPFQIRPLLHLSTGGFILSSTEALASWMTRGVHYSCLARIGGTPVAKRFLTYVGRLFETYALELARDAHRVHPDVRVLGEETYDNGGSQTCDIAVIDGSDLVLIEVEARRFSRRALLSLEPEEALAEVETMVVEKARQLSRCIDALQRTDSPARLPGVDITRVERIWPVLVLEGAIAHTPVLRDHLTTRLGAALNKRGVERLAILSISDFEILCGLIEHGHHLPMTLKRWQHGSYRDSDFRFFLNTKSDLSGPPRRARSINQRWDRLVAAVDSAFTPQTLARIAREAASDA